MAKQELLGAIRERYRGPSKKDKSRILDEFITVTGHHRKHGIRLLTQRQSAWYAKPAPTFVDAIALLRRHLWIASEGFSMSPPHPNGEKAHTVLYARLLDSIAYAA